MLLEQTRKVGVEPGHVTAQVELSACWGPLHLSGLPVCEATPPNLYLLEDNCVTAFLAYVVGLYKLCLQEPHRREREMHQETVLPKDIHSNADTALNNSTFSSNLSYLVKFPIKISRSINSEFKDIQNLMGQTQE